MALKQVGDCLNIAGYDVNPEHLKGRLLPGVSEHKRGVILLSEQGGKAVRINIDFKTGDVTALDGGDLKRLTAAGCDVAGSES